MSWIPTLTLFVMMLALGMTLRPLDFRRLATMRRAVLLGLLGQLVLLPLVAFALARVFPLSRTQAIGLVLIAACPGGVVSNVVSRFARGDVALSISLTAASSLVCFLSLPFVVGLALRAFGGDGPHIELAFADMAAPLFGTTALPALLGMAVLQLRPALAERLHRPLLGLSTLVLMLLVIGLAVGVARSSSELSLGELFRDVIPPVVALVSITMGVGLACARALGLDSATARTLALEIGLQNFNLALVVAMSVIGEQRYAGPALVYLPVMYGFAGIVIAWGIREGRGEAR
ncbi:MAG TPA: bile acid:sodium symporter [Myxococcota bacterium]|nr:bile acid:sodium symporter [Myxococcota bacterium]